MTGMMNRTLKDVLYEVVHQSGIDARVIAERLGMSYQMLLNAANPNLEDFKFQARHIIGLTLLTKDFRLLDYLEASCGRVAYSLPEIPKEMGEISALVTSAVKEFGDVLTEAGKALADGRIDLWEAKRLEKEIMDQVRVVMALLEAVKRQAERG